MLDHFCGPKRSVKGMYRRPQLLTTACISISVITSHTTTMESTQAWAYAMQPPFYPIMVNIAWPQEREKKVEIDPSPFPEKRENRGLHTLRTRVWRGFDPITLLVSISFTYSFSHWRDSYRVSHFKYNTTLCKGNIFRTNGKVHGNE